MTDYSQNLMYTVAEVNFTHKLRSRDSAHDLGVKLKLMHACVAIVAVPTDSIDILFHDINGHNMLLTQALPTMMKHPLILTYDYLLALHSKKGSSKTTPWKFFQ